MTEKKTSRTLDGRLFPSIVIGDFSLSIQGGTGYRSMPDEDFPYLEDYTAVEVGIFADRKEPIDPRTLNFPPDIAEKFPYVSRDGVPIAGYVSQVDVKRIIGALMHASLNPNSGYPRGSISWTRGKRPLYHGTSAEAADSIIDHGVDMNKCTPGYFGEAFYVADDKDLAQSNYADMSDDEGAVIALHLSESARILDLRNAEDSMAWQMSGLEKYLGKPGFANMAVKAGIDGIYDRSVGGLALYNPKVIIIDGLVPAPEQSSGHKMR